MLAFCGLQVALTVVLVCIASRVQSYSFADLSYEALNLAITSLDGNYAAVDNAKDLYGIPFAKEVVFCASL